MRHEFVRMVLMLVLLVNFAVVFFWGCSGGPKAAEVTPYFEATKRLRALEEASVIVIDQDASDRFYDNTYCPLANIAGDVSTGAGATINQICVSILGLALLNGTGALIGILLLRPEGPVLLNDPSKGAQPGQSQ